MGRLWDSVFLMGIALLALVSVAMFGVDATVTANDVFSLGRDVSGSAAPRVPVSLRASLNTQDQLDNYPKIIGGWESVKDYSDPSLQNLLRADFYILRNYRGNNQSTPPFFLLLLHSQLTNSFHDPRDCYRAEYTIGPLTPDFVTVQGVPGITSIPVNRLEIYKADSKGTVTERMLVLYTYFHRVESNSSEITVLRVSTPVDSFKDAAAEQTLKGFMGSNFDQVLSTFAGDNGKLISYIAGDGVRGYLMIALAFMIPLAMVVYPAARKKLFWQVKESDPKTEIIPDSQGAPAVLPETDDADELEAIIAEIRKCGTALEVYKIVLFVTKEASVVETDDFKQLTALAEECAYSNRVDASKIALAREVGERVVRGIGAGEF